MPFIYTNIFEMKENYIIFFNKDINSFPPVINIFNKSVVFYLYAC